MAATADARRLSAAAAILVAVLSLVSCKTSLVNTRTPPPASESSALDDFTAALLRMDDGKYAEAEQNLTDAIRKSSSDNPSYLYAELADCQRLQGKASSALSNYQRSIALDPARTSTRFRLVELYFSLNDAPDAITVLQSILAVDPRSTEALADLAALYEDSGDLDRAVENEKRLLDIDHSNLQAAANLLEMLARNRDYDGCLSAYSNLPEELRSDFFILMEKSFSQKQKGDYWDCLVTLEAARTASGSGNEPYFREKAEVQFFLDDRQGCLDSLDDLSGGRGAAGLKPFYQALRSTLLKTDLTNAMR